MGLMLLDISSFRSKLSVDRASRKTSASSMSSTAFQAAHRTKVSLSRSSTVAMVLPKSAAPSLYKGRSRCSATAKNYGKLPTPQGTNQVLERYLPDSAVKVFPTPGGPLNRIMIPFPIILHVR